MTAFNAEQTAQLLRPIAPQRVLSDGKGHSHVSQQDVTAHLIRVFGFGGFDTEVLAADCVFERPTLSVGRGKKEPDPTRYDVCYRVLMRLTIKDADGRPVARYEDGSTATAQNQTLGDGHDLAYKSAISLAKKRCAINLGDQFGLSLYNKGQTDALVRGTLVKPSVEGESSEPADMQAGVPRQVALGNDETDYEPGEPAASQPAVTVAEPDEPDWSALDVERFQQLIDGATTAGELQSLAADIAASTITGPARDELRRHYSARVKAVSV